MSRFNASCSCSFSSSKEELTGDALKVNQTVHRRLTQFNTKRSFIACFAKIEDENENEDEQEQEQGKSDAPSMQ